MIGARRRDVAATPAPAVAAAPRIVVVDQPAAGRTAIVVAHAGPLRTSADWASAMVANAVLSGYSGRLNEEIRVKRGLSYGANSSYVTGRYAGSILASTLVEHAKAPEALDIMLSTIASLGGSAPAGADELLARRTSLLGGMASGIETIGGLVRNVAANAFAGLPLDALTTAPAALSAVEPGGGHALRGRVACRRRRRSCSSATRRSSSTRCARRIPTCSWSRRRTSTSRARG